MNASDRKTGDVATLSQLPPEFVVAEAEKAITDPVPALTVCVCGAEPASSEKNTGGGAVIPATLNVTRMAMVFSGPVTVMMPEPPVMPAMAVFTETVRVAGVVPLVALTDSQFPAAYSP